MIILSLIVITIAIISVGSASIRVPMFVRAKCKLEDKSEILLTFDDGPSENTLSVLDVLRKNNIRAIFFLIGKNIEKYPELVEAIINDGHIVGNHTFAHNPFNAFRSEKFILADMRRCHNMLMITPNLFRPALGITNFAIARAINQMNYRVLGWSLRSYDTFHIDREKIFARVARKLRGGDIILLHDRVEKSNELAEKIINLAKNRGLTFADPQRI